MTDTELNDACAVEILGWKRGQVFWRSRAGTMCTLLGWEPVSRHEQAFAVLYRLPLLGFHVNLCLHPHGHVHLSIKQEGLDGGSWRCDSDSPRDWCRVALEAVRGKQQKGTSE